MIEQLAATVGGVLLGTLLLCGVFWAATHDVKTWMLGDGTVYVRVQARADQR